MAESRSLMSVLALWSRNLPTLMIPPGSTGLVAAIVAVAGWEIGLNMPYTVADILAVRSVGAIAQGLVSGESNAIQALQALYSTLKALPEPSIPAVISAILMATILLAGAGGWINTSLALVRGETPDAGRWWAGVKRSWISTLWFLILFGLAFGAMGASTLLSTAVVRGAMLGSIASGMPTILAAVGCLSLLGLTFAGACYGIAVTSLTGVVAIAEPRTPFLKLPLRARRVFLAGHGWSFLRQLSVAMTAWIVLKGALYQLIVPFSPVKPPFDQVASAGGALLYSLLTLGDGLVLLLAILLAARTYHHGSREVT